MNAAAAAHDPLAANDDLAACKYEIQVPSPMVVGEEQTVLPVEAVSFKVIKNTSGDVDGPGLQVVVLLPKVLEGGVLNGRTSSRRGGHISCSVARKTNLYM